MTKKDYILIAEAIANASIYLEKRVQNGYLDRDDAAREQEGINEVAREIADALALENDRFNEQKFLAACRA